LEKEEECSGIAGEGFAYEGKRILKRRKRCFQRWEMEWRKIYDISGRGGVLST